jgi:exodeoxyribonuclease V beta subunit
LASFRLSDTFEGWRTRPEVRERFDEAMAAYRIDPSERESSERIVWSAYTTAVQLPAGHRIAGLAWAPRAAREMSFVYPMPGHEDGPGRVLVRGSLDLAFEHEGLTYFVDWKSDSLSSYELPSMARRVEEHYVDQLQLYSLAIAKLLGIRSALEHEARFGGLLYCFLRGFGPHGAGLWSVRPTWNDLLSWQDRLRAWRPEGRS